MTYNNFSEEFFYDKTFDDYERKYIMRFLMNDIHSNMVVLSDEVYIMRQRPLDMELRLSDVIGIYYPRKDSKGIYGKYKIFQDSFKSCIEFCTLKAHGLYKIENEMPVEYRLWCVYIDI